MSNVESLDDTASDRWNHLEVRAGDAAPVASAIDRSPVRAFVLLSVVYFVAVFALSSMKLLWLDELITLHIAKLGGPHIIWTALARGADPNPPVTHVLVHYSRALFGDHEWAYRLPAFVGYWVGLLSLFLYLRRRLPGTWAIAGTVLSMCMAAFEYAYESRSYGIFYGLAMLAFLCWSRAVDAERSAGSRWMALAGMMVALAAGISTNYFAVLAFLPVSFGEAARTLIRARQERVRLLRTVDARVWIAIAVAGTPLLAYRSLIAHSIAQFAPYAWNKVSLQQVADSYTEMVETMLGPLLALFVFAILLVIVVKFVGGLCPVCRSRYVPRWLEPLVRRMPARLPLPIYEAVGVAAFMLYPVLGYIIASIRGGMLSPRFVIPVCYGFAIAGIVVAFQVFGRLRYAAVALLTFFCAWFLCREAVVGYWYEEQKQCFYKVLAHLPEAEAEVPADAPIAVPDPLLALTLQHYAPADIAKRLVFPVDFPAIRDIRHDDSPEENLWAGRNFLYSLKIMPVATFAQSAHEYLVIASDGNWYLEDLARHHFLWNRLPINTRAAAMGGFTPLARGTPVFYTASWDRPLADVSSPFSLPIPFHASDELPHSLPAGATP